MTMHGTVRIWNVEKGYGFITPDGGATDAFVHHTEVTRTVPGRVNLAAGQRVSFDMTTTPKGLRAVNVEVLEASPYAEAP